MFEFYPHKWYNLMELFEEDNGEKRAHSDEFISDSAILIIN
jgi:hypothetical protein